MPGGLRKITFSFLTTKSSVPQIGNDLAFHRSLVVEVEVPQRLAGGETGRADASLGAVGVARGVDGPAGAITITIRGASPQGRGVDAADQNYGRRIRAPRPPRLGPRRDDPASSCSTRLHVHVHVRREVASGRRNSPTEASADSRRHRAVVHRGSPVPGGERKRFKATARSWNRERDIRETIRHISLSSAMSCGRSRPMA